MKWLRGFLIGEIVLTLIFFLFHLAGPVFAPLSYLVIFPAAFVRGNVVFYHQIAVRVNERMAFNTALADTLEDSRRTALARQLHVDEVDLSAAVLEDDALQNPARSHLENILTKITEKAMPFSEAARYFSEDISAADNGDLGVILVKDIPDWLKPVIVMPDNRTSLSIVESPKAFWVVQVVSSGGQEEQAWVHLRGISVNKRTLEEIIKQDAQDHPSFVFIF